MTIQHVIPLLDDAVSARMRSEQTTALKSIDAAVSHTRHEVLIQFLCHPDSATQVVMRGSVEPALPNLRSALADLLEPSATPTLPYLADLFQAINPRAELVILTNPDIGVEEDFYQQVYRLHMQGFSGSICRRTLPRGPEEYETLHSIYGESGFPHSGHDCFFFPPSVVPRLLLGEVFLGAPPVGQLLLLNISLTSDRAQIFEDFRATWHFGDQREWASSARSPLAELNNQMAKEVLAELIETYGEETVLHKIRSLRLRRLFELYAYLEP